jgi:uncharacterized protein
MRIGVIGATGTIGSRVVNEALNRGHQVTAFTRDATTIDDSPERSVWRTLDVLNGSQIDESFAGLDVVISAFGAGNGARNPSDAVAQAIADPGAYPRAAHALLAALAIRPATRLIWVGGAATLEVSPGLVFVDSVELLNSAIDQFGLPREYASVMLAHKEALDVLRTSNRLWTYFSPAIEIAPGERTGRFRIGGDQPVMDADGRSRISAEDAAVALIDEAELPRYVQRRFTAGY